MVKPLITINDTDKFLEMAEKRLGVEKKKIVDLFHYADDAGYISLQAKENKEPSGEKVKEGKGNKNREEVALLRKSGNYPSPRFTGYRSSLVFDGTISLIREEENDDKRKH